MEDYRWSTTTRILWDAVPAYRIAPSGEKRRGLRVFTNSMFQVFRARR